MSETAVVVRVPKAENHVAALRIRFDASAHLGMPDHWVVATGAVNINNRIVFSYLPSANNSGCINIPSDTPSNDNWPVTLSAFSWGKKSQELKQGTSVSSFLGRYHGALVYGSVP